MNSLQQIQSILKGDNKADLRAFFAFDSSNSYDNILFKFNCWSRKFFFNYFTSKDASFHREIDMNNLKAYRGDIVSFVNIAFRGAAKTARTKLFLAFCILNDLDHSKRFIKILSENGDNSIQIVTDIYNMLVSKEVSQVWPESFARSTLKREERMGSFTTVNSIKVIADTVGVDQRGALQEDARPDLIWYEDFENRTTLRSARKTKNIWDNMEEARTGLAKGGSCIYTCNYISEQGNVHILVMKKTPKNVVLIIPIEDEKGEPTWIRYSKEDIAQMRIDDDDFEGERLCKPSASKDVFFDRETLDKQEIRVPIRTVAGFKIYYAYDPSHRYASGHDVAGGVGLDSSTSAFIDFDTIPARVVATFNSNTIRPDTFGDEIQRESDIFGGCLVAPERNNHGHATIARCKQLEVNMYSTKQKETKVANQQVADTVREYGWLTTGLSKPKMLFALNKAVYDGLLTLSDPDIIVELKAYTRNDLMDKDEDPRLTTRHFDFLIAVAIAWQMKDYADYAKEEESTEVYEEEDVAHPEIWG